MCVASISVTEYCMKHEDGTPHVRGGCEDGGNNARGEVEESSDETVCAELNAAWRRLGVDDDRNNSPGRSGEVGV